MSRGYDGPEIDDFRDSGSAWGRDPDRDRSSDWNSRFALHNIHREEERADTVRAVFPRRHAPASSFMPDEVRPTASVQSGTTGS